MKTLEFPGVAARATETSGDRAERAELARLLAEEGGNLARVARRLGVGRNRLRFRIRCLGLTMLGMPSARAFVLAPGAFTSRAPGSAPMGGSPSRSHSVRGAD